MSISEASLSSHFAVACQNFGLIGVGGGSPPHSLFGRSRSEHLADRDLPRPLRTRCQKLILGRGLRHELSEKRKGEERKRVRRSDLRDGQIDVDGQDVPDNVGLCRVAPLGRGEVRRRRLLR